MGTPQDFDRAGEGIGRKSFLITSAIGPGPAERWDGVRQQMRPRSPVALNVNTTLGIFEAATEGLPRSLPGPQWMPLKGWLTGRERRMWFLR